MNPVLSPVEARAALTEGLSSAARASPNGIHVLRTLPHSSEAEEALLSACLIDGAEVVGRCIDSLITPQSFYDTKHGIVFETLLGMHAAKKPIEPATVAEELRDANLLDQIGGFPFITQISRVIPTTAQTSYFVSKVAEQATLREIIRVATRAVEDCHGFSGDLHGLTDDLRRRLDFATTTVRISPETKLRSILDSRSFNFAKPLQEPVPRFLINGKAVSTSGNLTAIIAQAKAGKTATIAAAIAAAIVAHFQSRDADTLGITATAPGKLRLLHIDTEQSAYDHDSLIRNALRRAGATEVPPWLDSRFLTGFSAKDLRESLRLLMADAHAAGGIFAVIIDGIADLAINVNDLAESNSIVAELHALSITYDCPIICVIHDNEGRDPNGDGRGHLGKQLMRKAESNLRLKKTEEITVIFSERMRKAPIFEKDGPRFKWSDSDKMHVSCSGPPNPRDEAKRDKLHHAAVAVFEELGKESGRWAEILAAIEKVSDVKRSRAEDRFSEFKKMGVIFDKGMGFWAIKPATGSL